MMADGYDSERHRGGGWFLEAEGFWFQTDRQTFAILELLLWLKTNDHKIDGGWGLETAKNAIFDPFSDTGYLDFKFILLTMFSVS